MKLHKQPTQQDHVNDAVREIYQRHSAGCCQHLVLDDENVDDESLIVAEATWKAECGYACCYLFNEIMKDMSEGERLASIEEAKYKLERQTIEHSRSKPDAP